MNITISRDGQNYGPYTLDQVKEYLGNGTLNESDLAWHDDSTGWLSLKEVLSTFTGSPSPPRLPQPQAVMVPLATAHNPIAPEASQPRVDTPVKQSGTKLRLTGKIVAGIIGVAVIIIAFVHLSHRPSLTTNGSLTNPLLNANTDSPTNSPISRPTEQIANVPNAKDSSSAIASPSVLSQTNESSTAKPEIAPLKTTVLETKDFTDIDSQSTIRFTRLAKGTETQWGMSYNGGACTIERENMERFGKALQTFLEWNSKNHAESFQSGDIDSFTALSTDNKTTTIKIGYVREGNSYLTVNIHGEDSGNSSINFHADYVAEMQAYFAYELTGIKPADKPWPGQGLVDFLRKDCLPDPFGVPVVHVSKPTQAILSNPIVTEPTGELIPYLLPLATKKDDKAFFYCFLNWTLNPGDPAREDKFRDDIPQDDRFWEKAVNALDLWLEPSYSSPVILHGLDPRMFHLNHDMGYIIDGSAPLVVAVNVRSSPRHVGFHDVIPSRSITYPMAEKFVTLMLLASDPVYTTLPYSCSEFTPTNNNEWAIMWEPGQNDLYLYTVSQKQSKAFLDSILRLTDALKKRKRIKRTR